MAISRGRGPLPTMTEEDVREAGERTTLPPPVPMEELVAGMMDADPNRNGRPEIEHHTLPPPQAAQVTHEACGAYLAQLGGPYAIPVLALTPASELRDYLAKSVLSTIDGRRRVEQILEVAPLPKLDGLRLLCELLEGGYIVTR